MANAAKFELGGLPFRIGIGLALVVGTFMLRQVLVAQFGMERPSLLIFYPVILVAALFCGSWAGLLATALAASLAALWILPSSGLSPIERTSDSISLASFLAVGALMTAVTEYYRRRQARTTAFTIEEALREARALRQARETREQLASVVESSDDAIISKTLDGTITAWNRGADKVFGYSAREAIGKSILFLIPPERAHEEADIQARLGRGENVNHFETVRVRKDGKLIDVSVTISPMRDSGGAIIGASKIARDVTERKMAEDALREQREILDLAQVMIRDTKGEILMWNLGSQKLYGYTEEQAVGRISHELLCTEFPEPLQQIERTLELDGVWEGELLHRKSDGSQLVVSSVWTLHLDRRGGPPRILESNTDISAVKRAEEATRASQARLEGIVDSAMDAVISVNEQQRIIVFNRAAESIFQCSATKALGSTLEAFIPEALRATHGEHIQSFEKEGVTSRAIKSPAILTAVRSSGEEFPIEATISRVIAAGQTVFTVILRDITERQRDQDQLRWSEEQLRRFAADLQTVGERERLRLSRELHDQMGSVLTGMKMDLHWIVHKYGAGGDEWVPLVQDSIQTVDSIVNLVRRMATELRPGILDTAGLGPAIEGEANKFERHSGFITVVQVPEDPIGLTADQKIAIFRICQEAMTNIARHAEAKHAHIKLVQERDFAVLTISDDGKGFEVDSLSRTSALGVLGMRERALFLQAPLLIESEAGIGTTITLRMPLEHERE